MSSKIHTVCETTNLKTRHYAARIWDAVADVDIDNGTLGYLGELVEEGGVIYNFNAGTAKGKEVVLVHNPEWTEDTSRMTNQRKDKFFIPKGVSFRAFTLTVGDEFALSPEGFVGEPVVGKYVSINENGKLVVADEADEAAVMVGKIMRKRQIGSTLVTSLRPYGYERMMYEVKVESLA